MMLKSASNYQSPFFIIETANPLAESLGGYENISIVHELEPPSIEFLRIVKDEITAGEMSFCFIFVDISGITIWEKLIHLGYFAVPVEKDALSKFKFSALNLIC